MYTCIVRDSRNDLCMCLHQHIHVLQNTHSSYDDCEKFLSVRHRS